MAKDDVMLANSVAQKFISTLSKLRPAEDKAVKALPTWTEPELDDILLPFQTDSVDYHAYMPMCDHLKL